MLSFNTRLVLAQFVARVNRFTVEIMVEGVLGTAHLPNSGRLLNVLQTGQPCWVSPVQSTNRKTNYDLLAIELPAGPVLVDARLPGQVIKAGLLANEIPPLAGYGQFKSEHRYGDSRIDFYLQGAGLPPCLVEVKSASDYTGRVARFPDAPSARARRHLEELTRAVEDGWRGVALLAAQMPWAESVQLNDAIDPAFVEAARLARSAGVEFLAYAFCPRLPWGVELGLRIPVVF